MSSDVTRAASLLHALEVHHDELGQDVEIEHYTTERGWHLIEVIGERARIVFRIYPNRTTWRLLTIGSMQTSVGEISDVSQVNELVLAFIVASGISSGPPVEKHDHDKGEIENMVALAKAFNVPCKEVA